MADNCFSEGKGKKILEQKLKESEAKYKDLFDHALDAIYVHDTEGYFIDVNNAALDILGCAREDIIGSHISRWLRPECVNLTLEAMEKQIKGLPVVQPVIRELIRKDGKPVFVEINSREVKDGDRVIGFYGIARDITEKIKMQREIKEYQEKLEKSYEQLKESEVRYKSLFDNASDSIYCYDSSGYFLDVNTTALELLGCAKEELIGTHVSEWITPESLKITQEDLKKRITGEPGKEAMILDVIDKEGKHHCMEIRRRIIRQGGKIIVHGIGRDITEKRRLEEELKKSEKRHRDLFENAIVPMYILDVKGKILKINKVGLRVLDSTEEEVIGTNMSKWLSPDSLKVVRESQKKRFSGESMDHTDIIEFVGKNGEKRWAETTSRVIKDGDRIIGIHGIGKDITENMRLKQELMKSNKQKKLLCYLIEGTRGGKTRALILKHLIDRSCNAHQLARALGKDYKTIRHHVGVLVKNGIITRGNDGYTALYYLSKNIELDLNEFTQEI